MQKKARKLCMGRVPFSPELVTNLNLINKLAPNNKEEIR